MTGLSNFRYFERRLSEDLIRAKRYKQTLTLIIMDIDHFKKFNDVYGHKAGNVLLKQFGQLLKDCLRESDLPARYGGEEFIAICPAISGLEALIVAERIRTTFEQARFDLGESLTGAPVNVKITVSVGCATYPDHGLSPNHLVRQADRALYAAKNRGRNIVVSCDELSESDNPSPEKSPSER
jgi:diguanylate cyclase (GGDEF)-like protein